MVTLCLLSTPCWAKKQKAPPSPASPASPGVRGMFEEAQRHYLAGRYTLALRGYHAILTKYSGHEPSLLQSAKALYRLDRFREAYGFYQRIPLGNLDVESTYEYGWTFYQANAWEGAYNAFRKIPKGHALYDLANYYGGIAAIKLRRYDEAEKMLDQAVVLPDRLAKSRAIYSKHVGALILLKEKGNLDAERYREKEAQSIAEKQRALDLKAMTSTNKPTDVVARTEHQGFRNIARYADLKLQKEHQTVDYHGLRTSSFDATIGQTNVASGVLLSARGERPPVLGLQVKLSAEHRNSKGQEQRLITDDEGSGLVRAIARDFGTNEQVHGKVESEIFGEVPLPGLIWWSTGANVQFTYPNFRRGNRSGSRKGYTAVAGRRGAATLGSEASYEEILDADTKPITKSGEFQVYSEGQVIDALTFKGQAGYKSFDYVTAESTIDGPDVRMQGEAQITQLLPFSVAISLQLTGQYLKNYIFHSIPSFREVASDGQVGIAKFTFEASPISFLQLGISEELKRSKWLLQNEAARESFELNVSDYTESFVAWVKVNLLF